MDTIFPLIQKLQATSPLYTIIDRDIDPHRIADTSLHIWSGGSDFTIYPHPSLNWLFRAHHDNLHISTGLGFTLAEEIEVTKLGIRQLSLDTLPEIAKLYWLDNVGQQLYFYQYGHFPLYQKAFIRSAWDDPYYTDPR